jgi:spore coat protein A, manganese oxidase
MKKRGRGFLLLGLALLVMGLMTAVPALASPSMDKWVDPLPVPPVAQQTFNPMYSSWADYYEITMQASQHQFNAALGQATVWTYGQPGQAPVLLGPTIVAKTGRPVVVKYINQLPTDPEAFPLKDSIDPTIMGYDIPTGAAIPHLHGGHTAAQYDGTPDQWWTADGQKGMDYTTDTFTYVNDQPAALLWYHDHTMGSTRFKPYLGLAAAYVLFDGIDNGRTINGQRVPTGYGKYHLPLVLQDKTFNDDGSLYYPTAADGGSGGHPIWVPEFFGDTPVVNGKAYPYLDVQPRRYRLRLLNGSQARFYNLSFDTTGDADIPFWVIGSEQGLLPQPVKKWHLTIAPGERYDLIVDFKGVPLGSEVMLRNDAAEPYPDGDAPQVTDMLKINVNTQVPANDPDTTVNPANLRLRSVARLTKTAGLPPRTVVAKETMDMATDSPMEMLLNGYHFHDAVTDYLKNGTTEVWRWVNLTVDAHPMHTHLFGMQVVNRQRIDVDGYTTAWNAYLDSGRKASLKPRLADYLVGKPIPPDPEEMGFKDTVKAPPGFVTRTISQYTLPWTARQSYDKKTNSYGQWVYHCHILEHEENDMMRPFVVVK